MTNRILIVDDEPRNLDVLHNCLREANFKVTIAKSGEAALKRIAYTKPDLILLDINMPGIDGYETCRRLKNNELSKDTPIIFITVKTETVDKVRGFEMGAVDYIAKPFQPEEVVARIEKHLTIRNLQKRLEEQNTQLQQEIAERKQTEAALRESEAKYRSLVESTNVIPWQMDVTTSRFTYMAPQVEQLLGYPANTWLDINTWTERIHPEDSRKALNYCTAATQRGEDHDFEYRAIAVDGRVVWIRDVVSVLMGEDGSWKLIGYMFNITEHKQAEKKFELIFNRSIDIIGIGDFKGYLTMVNPAFEQMFGYTKEELLNTHYHKFIHPDDKNITAEVVGESVYDGKPMLHLENRWICKDGSHKWIEWMAYPDEEEGEIYTIGHDVTDRKQAEEALRMSQEIQDAILSTTDVLLAYLDKEFNFIAVNQTYADAGHKRREDFVGQNHFALYPHQENQALFENVVETGKALYITAKPFEHPDQPERGTTYWNWSLIPIKDESGRVQSLVFSVLDVTELMRAEESLQTRTRELALLNKAGRVFASSLELDQVLITILDQVRRIIGIVACSVWLVDSESGDLVCREVASPRDDIVRGWRLAPGQGLAGWMVQHGESLNVPDTRIDECFFKGIDVQTGLESRSVLGVLLRNKDGVFGALELVDEAENRFSPNDARLAEALGTLASIAIDNAYLHQQTQQDAKTKTMLLQEVNHRVKNNLAAIIGMLYVEQRHAKEENLATHQAILEDMSNRIQGLSTVHYMLSAGEWSPLPLDKLVGQIIASVSHLLPLDEQVSVKVSPSSIKIIPKLANSLALVINELTTNTIKYAWPDNRAGQISVNIEREDDLVLLEFRDDGVGYPADVLSLERHNVGWDLIQNIVQTGLRGEVMLRNDYGAVATIKFPIDGA